jgi:hypothetical protein
MAIAETREHRVQAAESRQGYADAVVNERPEKVLPDFRERGVRDLEHAQHESGVRPHEHDSSGVLSNVGTARDRYTHIGFGERWSIIEPVANHGHVPAALL